MLSKISQEHTINVYDEEGAFFVSKKKRDKNTSIVS